MYHALTPAGKRSTLSGDSDDDGEPNTYDYNDSFIDDEQDGGGYCTWCAACASVNVKYAHRCTYMGIRGMSMVVGVKYAHRHTLDIIITMGG